MVSLIFPQFQGSAWLILTCLHHFPHTPSRGPLFLDQQCLSLCVLVRQSNLYARAHSAHISCLIPHDFLQSLPQCSLQQALSMITLKSALMTRMSILSSCSISFYSHMSPFTADSLFYNWMAASCDTDYLFGLCLERQWWYIPWLGLFDATLVSWLQKIHFHSKITYEYFQIISTVLSQIVCKTQQILLIHMTCVSTTHYEDIS